MEISIVNGDSKGYAVAMEEGQEAGRMTYSRAGENLIIIDHTEVSDLFKGRSVGKQLFMGLVSHARNEGILILPVCPFAKSLFEKLNDVGDVLYRSEK